MADLVHLDVTPAESGAEVATLTLDSPHNRNALSTALVDQLRQHLDDIDRRDSVRAVVVQAAGPVFCAGADMSEALEVGMQRSARALVALQRQIAALSQPVVARVHGPVRAGGLGILAASDVAVAADHVTFAFTEVRLGLAPATISLTVLPRLSSRGAAATFLSGEAFDASEAVRIGLLSDVVPAEQLDAAVARVVAAWSLGSRQGLRETKAVLNAGLLERIDTHGQELAARSAELFASEEARAAMEEFLASRRSPA